MFAPNRSINLGPILWFGAAVVAALLVGLALANPYSTQSILTVGAFFGLLATPWVLRKHHFMLVALVGAPINAFFLPGQPDLWTPLAFLSLGISVVSSQLRKANRHVWNMRVGGPLIFLLAVIILTAKFRGGMGSRVMGSTSWGGMRYVLVISAIVAYFAISARSIPLASVRRYVGFYFLSGTLAIVSNLIAFAGPAFYFLYNFFPVELSSFQFREGPIERLTGLDFAAVSIMYWMLCKYGIRGLTRLDRHWRLPIFVILMGLALLGGFRSTLIILILILSFQFVFERLYLGNHIFALAGAMALTLSLLVAFAEQLPISIQRSLSFLPIHINPVARADADGTIDWRLEMWKVVIPDVPKYLWLGKGFAYDGSDYYLTTKAASEGRAAAYESTLISGNYHQGILTLIIPFGLFGFLAFVWFAAAGWWVLFKNYRRGRPELLRLNTFLLSYYSARLLFYLTLYGQFDLDLIVFTSSVALSIAVNRLEGQTPTGNGRSLNPKGGFLGGPSAAGD